MSDSSQEVSHHPSDLELKQVLLIHRHGERSPVKEVMAKHLPSDAWNVCSLAPFVNALHTVLLPESPEPKVPKLHPPKIAEIQVIQGDVINQPLLSNHTRKQLTPDRQNSYCHPGHLTDIGKIHMMNRGKKLRELYVDKLGFLAPHLNNDFNQNHLYVRSTGVLRTLESVQYLLGGLFPLESREPGKGSDIKIHIQANETAIPDIGDGCPKLRDLVHGFITTMTERSAPLMASLTYQLADKFPLGDSVEPKLPPVGSAMPGGDRSFTLTEIEAILDAFKCYEGTGAELPKGVTPQIMDDLHNVVRDAFWDSFQYGPKEITTLSVGRFLKDLKETLTDAVKETPISPKFAIFSGHDTTVGPVLGAMGTFTGKHRKWPVFGAVISIELFEDKTKKYWLRGKDHYVRMSLDGEPLIVPECAKAGSHFLGDPTLCKYSVFVNKMSQFIPKNYNKECMA